MWYRLAIIELYQGFLNAKIGSTSFLPYSFPFSPTTQRNPFETRGKREREREMDDDPSSSLPSKRRVVGDYMLGPRIGSGSFSVVWQAQHRLSGKVAAVKEIDKRQLSDKVRDSLMKEITILRRVSHPNIVALLDAIQTEDTIYLVLEHCAGGDLSAYIHRRRRVSESVARHFMRQLASGLQVLRENNLIHRDLKPQNLLLSTQDETPMLKIGDFGFARYLMPQGLADTLCGSPLYMAPEIMENKKYDAKADLWSVGAILFQLVTGKPPFDGNSQFQLFQNILAFNELQFPQDVLADLHPDCIDLCRSLLLRNPVERLTFEGFFNHKFVAMPRTTQRILEAVENIKDANLGRTLNDDPSNSLLVQSIQIGSMNQGLLSASAPRVSDSLEFIEREYVLVNAHFASMEILSSSLETSLRDNATIKFPSYTTKFGKSTAGLMQTGKPFASSICVADSMGNHVSVPLQSSNASEKNQGTKLHPSNRLQSLYQYAYALTELAQEKLNVGLHMESFSIELVILSVWKEALRACNSWIDSTAEVDTLISSSSNECPSRWEDDNSTPNLAEGDDFRRLLSVCSLIEQGFIVAYDRAEKISSSIRNIGNMEMPDAMEIIYQTALSVGKSGAVDELMGHRTRAATSYSKAITFLTFIATEAASVPLNPPFLLSPDDQHRIHKYIISLRAHLNQSQTIADIC